MLFESSICPIIIAGLMNGSFVIPARYVKSFVNEKIWLYHSIIGLAIIPWIILFLTLPNAFHDYTLLHQSILLFLIFGGIVFGLGQVCFAYAIESIGIALSFTINLGIGVTIGSMFVVFYKSAFLTTEGLFVTLAVFLIVCSLIVYYFAGKNQSQKNIGNHSRYHAGWWLATLAGFASGFQNITFIIVASHHTAFQAENSFWVWPPFLLAASIPMFLGFFYRMNKPQTDSLINGTTIVRNLTLITLMGLFFTGSLALYSGGMGQLSHQQQIIGWPAFMVSIIFASQAWGWLQGKSSATLKSTFYMFCSAALLVMAIIILAVKPV